MGSVKDLVVVNETTTSEPGRGRFVFSDRYSVFDWGEMPDQIPGKGFAITLLGSCFFEKLEKRGIPTHYLGLVEGGEIKNLDELEKPTNMMEVKLLRVVHPGIDGDRYDYSVYRNQKGNLLIPLEVIYRNSLPPGSSIFGRLERGEITPQDLGLDAMPVPNQRLDTPILDVSTKLEITDRYMKWDEAQRIAALSDREVREIVDLAHTVNDLITDEFSKIGLVHEDGKIEVGYDRERRLILVDVLGTLDESRFTFEGLPVSKEIARIYYRQSAWYDAVEAAKKEDRQNWKEICRLKPEPLPARLKELISQVYCACTDEITGRKWFGDLPALGEIMGEVRDFLEPPAS